MENIAQCILAFCVSIPESLFELWYRPQPPASQQSLESLPPASCSIDQESQSPPRHSPSPPSPMVQQQLPPPRSISLDQELINTLHAKQEMEWQKMLINICFTSGLEIALHCDQTSQSKHDSLHLLSIFIALLFSSLFVSHFINPKFPRAAKVLDRVAVFLAATMFFITISIPFPPGVKWATWIIYAISLLAIAICNCC